MWKFLSTLLNWDPEESEKRKELRKIYNYLHSFSPPFISRKTREILPGFAKIVYTLTRSLFPIHSLLEKTILSRDYKMAELYKNYLIESYLPESEQTRRYVYTFKGLKERIFDSIASNEEIERIKQDFNEYIKLFNSPEYGMVNKDLNEFYKFVTICHHNYEPLLSLFDQELIISSNTYSPKFKSVPGSDIIPELMDLYYITADFSLSNIIELKLMQLIDRLRSSQGNDIKKKVTRLLARADKVLKTYLTPQVLLCLLQAIKSDPGFVADTSAESVDYLNDYKTKLTSEFSQLIDRVLREISENNIVQELEDLFKGEKLIPLDGYNDTERDYLLDNGMETFTHIKPFTILKNFLLLFEGKIKNVFAKLLFEGFFEDKAFQNNISNAFYDCVKSYNKIEQFETGLTEKATSSLLTVHNELQKTERDKSVIDKLNNIIIGINQRASHIIEEETNRFSVLIKFYGDVLADYKNKAPQYVSNIKVLGGNKNSEFIHDLASGYAKMDLFLRIMRNFTVIK